MGYKAYAEYKESGVEWLGKIPSHWSQCPVKRKFLIANGSTPKSGEAELWNGDILWITPADFSRASFGYLSDSARTITDVGLASCGTRLVPSNSIVVSVRAPIGEVIQAVPELCTNQGCKSLIKDASEIYERFFFYIFSCSSKQLNALGLGTTFMELSTHGLGQYRVPTPPEKEQELIAQFLDHKTAQIDRLIETKQELIEKLQEQRIATITQAVTKGVASGVAIKNSNNKWFDSIPAHWQVIRIKDLVVDAIAGPYGSSLTKPMYTNNGYRVYGQQQVIPENFSTGDYYISDEKYEEMRRYRTQPGDILISVMGTIGRAALVPDDAEPGIINPRLVLYRANKHIVRPEYLKNFINSQPSQNYFSLVAQGTTMEGINMALIGELAVAVPPLNEQDEILLFQQARTSRLERQTEAVTSAITRLQEYRTALITAAVTGQIDVRDWQPPPPDASAQDKEVA